MRITYALLVVAALAAAGCGDDEVPTGPTGPTTDVTIARTELFQGRLEPGATAFYSFTVLAERNVAVTLATLTDDASQPIDATVTIGFGIPQGTGCATTRTADASPALQAQIVNSTTNGLYCVNIRDTGALSATTNFSIKIRQEPVPTPDPSPVANVVFDSQLARGGVTTRTFIATGPGTVLVTLESTSPIGELIGVGLGIPRIDGAGCTPTRVVVTRSGTEPHLAMPVDVGFYCVRVFDPGTLPSNIGFSVRIAHP